MGRFHGFRRLSGMVPLAFRANGAVSYFPAALFFSFPQNRAATKPQAGTMQFASGTCGGVAATPSSQGGCSRRLAARAMPTPFGALGSGDEASPGTLCDEGVAATLAAAPTASFRLSVTDFSFVASAPRVFAAL